MSGRRAMAAVLLAATLVTGLALGVAADRLWISRTRTGRAFLAGGRCRRPRGPRSGRLDRLVARFTRRLGLSEQQQKQVRAALAASWKRMRAVRRRVEPELRGSRGRARGEIRRALNPGQRKLYDAMVRRYEARRAARSKGR